LQGNTKSKTQILSDKMWKTIYLIFHSTPLGFNRCFFRVMIKFLPLESLYFCSKPF